MLELAEALYASNKTRARSLALQVLRQARTGKRPAPAGNAANLLANLLRNEGKLGLALKYCRIGLDSARLARDRRIEADSLNCLGLTLWHKGEFDQAIAHFSESTRVFEALGDEFKKSRGYGNLGLVYWEKGDLVQARDYQQRSLQVMDRLNNRFGVGLAYLNLGLIQVDLGDWEQATECYYRALVEMEQRDDPTEVALCHSNLGEIYLRRGRLERARELFEQAIRDSEKAPSLWVKAEALGNLGEVFFRQGDLFRARDCYEQDIRLSRKMDDKEELAEALRRQSELLLALGNPTAAGRLLNQALRLTGRTGARKELGNIRRAIGNVLAATGKSARARRSFEAGIETLRPLDRSYELGRICLDYGRTIAPTDARQAELQLRQARAILCRLGAEQELEAAEALLARLTSDRQPPLALARNLARLATRPLALADFANQALQLLREALDADAGALLVNHAGVFSFGSIPADELERLTRQPESLSLPGARVCPVYSGGNRLALLVLKGRTIPEATLETAGSILALGLERLAGFRPPTVPLPARTPASALIGADTTLREILADVNRVAGTRVAVLIQGESGTGKELVARTIHRLSDRQNRPFVAINCAAIPETLLESELFGIEKGTATGVSERPGKFEQAQAGTVFLDEIADMSLGLQAKVLRLLQEKELERVGGRRTIAVDVRIVAATNKDLSRAIAAGQFRDDLYYRLNVVTLKLPPLRERKADIPQFVRRFMDRYCREYQRRLIGVTPAAMNILLDYDWPGNVRELENVIERAVVLARGDLIAPEDLPPELTAQTRPVPDFRAARTRARTESQDTEKEFVLQALNQHNWNMTRTAQALGVARRHLYRLLRKYGLTRPSASA
jgi:two-component system response regulator AtoC